MMLQNRFTGPILLLISVLVALQIIYRDSALFQSPLSKNLIWPDVSQRRGGVRGDDIKWLLDKPFLRGVGRMPTKFRRCRRTKKAAF